MYELIDGILAIGCGAYGYLAAVGKVQMASTDEKSEAWRKKYGKMFRVLGPIFILFGLYRLSQLFIGV